MRARTATITILGITLLATMTSTASSNPSRAPRLPDCTITGTSGDDTLRGTADRDIMCALAGDDFVLGRRGNDLILLGPGEDGFNGGRGSG